MASTVALCALVCISAVDSVGAGPKIPVSTYLSNAGTIILALALVGAGFSGMGRELPFRSLGRLPKERGFEVSERSVICELKFIPGVCNSVTDGPVVFDDEYMAVIGDRGELVDDELGPVLEFCCASREKV